MGGAQSNLKNQMISNLEKIQKDIEGFQNEGIAEATEKPQNNTTQNVNTNQDNIIYIFLIIAGLLFVASRNRDLVRKYINI